MLYITEHHLGQMMKNPCLCQFLLRICVESFFSDPTQTVQLVQQKDPISCMEDQRICHVDITAKQSTYPPCLALTQMLFYKCLYIFQTCFVHMYLFIMLLLQYSMYYNYWTFFFGICHRCRGEGSFCENKLFV